MLYSWTSSLVELPRPFAIIQQQRNDCSQPTRFFCCATELQRYVLQIVSPRCVSLPQCSPPCFVKQNKINHNGRGADSAAGQTVPLFPPPADSICRSLPNVTTRIAWNKTTQTVLLLTDVLYGSRFMPKKNKYKMCFWAWMCFQSSVALL